MALGIGNTGQIDGVAFFESDVNKTSWAFDEVGKVVAVHVVS